MNSTLHISGRLWLQELTSACRFICRQSNSSSPHKWQTLISCWSLCGRAWA